MKNLQAFTDKAAMGLSLLCTLHCLAFPLIIVLLPSLAALPLGSEAFHLWMVIAVFPTSIYALTMGCRQHKRYQLLVLGGVGLAFLALAIVLAETVFHHSSQRELIEKTLTTIGSLLIAFGHFKNYKLCQDQHNCDCPDHDAEPAR